MAEAIPPNESPAGPAMPGAPQERASVVQSAAPSDKTPPLPPPPSVGKQIAQLVLIPAVIAIVAIALFWLFGSMAATPDSIKDQIARLKQSSGYGGNLIAGAQDPRYKDRCQAAFQIATMIEKITDPGERRALSRELQEILRERVHRDDEELQYFLLMALGRLGQPEALDEILLRTDSPHLQVRIGMVGAVLSMADSEPDHAHRALPRLVDLLSDSHEQVRTLAAATIWKVAKPSDQHVVPALKEAMGSIGVDPNGRIFQATVSHAAIALAALGDPQGSAYVADVLLNRAELAKMRADLAGKSDAMMNANEQDHFLANVLHYVSRMPDDRVWKKVKDLSENDPSVSIRKAALQLMESRAPGAERIPG